MSDDRQALAEILDPDAFDLTRTRSTHPAAVIQWAARQHMAYEGAERLIAAGVRLPGEPTNYQDGSDGA